MRSKSQQLMNEISAYVDQYYSERHTAPSVNEIAKGVGIAKTTSYRYLVAMNDLGMLRYDGASRTITTRMISKFSESTVPAPVVGAIPCGTPEEEEENRQEPGFKYMNMDEALSYCGGDKSFVISIAALYIEESEENKTNIDRTYKEENWKEFATLVHALKSNSKTLGLSKMTEAALNMENAGKGGDAAYIKGHYEDFLKLYNEVLDELKKLQ